MGEVALLTGPGPVWRTPTADRSLPAVRKAPPQALAALDPAIRLLNAARLKGLAAYTRRTLLNRGWADGIVIGDAPRTRARSVVLYPAGSEAAGRRLAEMLHLRSAVNPRGTDIIVLLGRDSRIARPRLV